MSIADRLQRLARAMAVGGVLCAAPTVRSEPHVREDEGAPRAVSERSTKTGVSVAFVAERMDLLYRSKTSIAKMKLRIVKTRRTTEMDLKVWTMGDNKSLVVVQSPARDKGVATLRVDNNLWQYLPRISRTMRVPASMMLASWMGSDFTNDDLVNAASYRTDYTGAAAGEDEATGGLLFRFSAKPGAIGLWKHVDVVMGKAASLPLLARYYDRKDRLARTMRFEDVRNLGGRRIPTRLALQSTDKPDQHTEIAYEQLELDVPVSENTFSLAQLEREN